MSKKLKIGFVLDDTLDSPDGVQQHVLTVGKWMTKQGHEVHYLVGQTKRADIKNIHSLAKNLKVRFNQNRLSVPLPANKKKIIKLLQNLDLDIVHIQMPYSPLMAGRLINELPENVKVIGTFHIVPASWIQAAGSKSLKLLNKKTVSRFDQIIAVSNAAKIFAKTSLDIDSVVIPNPVELKKFSRRSIYNKKQTLVFLGRLVERKGCGYFLKAVNILQKNSKIKFKVLIGGKGPLKDKLCKYVNENKLKNIKFLGFIDENDKAKLLSEADIAVFPSTGGESFGISLVESMASGARVTLGGDNVGYHCVLSNYPELLVDPKNSKAFANRIEYFLENPKEAKKAHKWAKEAVKQYDINIVGKKILKTYRKTINEQV
jgi:phosphatidylinositol alpha-mannosyltransferase